MYRVAIVGRPNVGKSTLFNKLTRSRKAIVGDQPGITRDRNLAEAEWDGKRFSIVDTGGILPDESGPGADPDAPERMLDLTLEQAEVALQDSDLILFLVDGRQGLTPADRSLNSFLRESNREFLLVVNKIDTARIEDEAAEFYQLGVDRLFCVSAEHSLGLDELLEEILSRVEESPEAESREEIRVAIIGRPNMGKSSLLNQLLGEERVIVTETPGTTRDAVDSALTYRDRHYRLIDTAGIRRKGKTKGMAEKLSVVMARRNMERADVVLLVIDAVEGATKLDATVGGYAHEAGKSLIIVVNKWDLVDRDSYTAIKLEKEYRSRMRFLDFAPMVFVSALTGQRVFKLLDFVDRAYDARRKRVSTGELNRLLQKELQPLLESTGSSRKTPVMYASQTSVSPPTFVIFTRTRRKLHFSLERFVINRLRQAYGFFATPIRVRQRIRPRKR